MLFRQIIFALFIIVSTSISFADNENFNQTIVSGDYSERSLNSSKWLYVVTNNLDLSGASLKQADFRLSGLSSVMFNNSDLSDAFIGECTLINANFEDAIITRTRFLGSLNNSDYNLSYSQLASTKNFRDGDLSGISIYLHYMLNWDLSNKNFTSATFVSCYFGGANLLNSNLSNAHFSDVEFENTIIDNANLSATVANGFSFSKFATTSSYKNNTLGSINLKDNDLTEWNFTGKSMLSSNFANSNLTNANFTNAGLEKANFASANLSNAIFSGAVIAGASFSSSNITFAQLMQIPSIGVDKSIVGLDLSNTKMSDIDFSDFIIKDSNLSGMSTPDNSIIDMSNATIENCSMNNIDLGTFNLTNASIESVEMLGVVASSLMLSGATFSEVVTSKEIAEILMAYAAIDLTFNLINLIIQDNPVPPDDPVTPDDPNVPEASGIALISSIFSLTFVLWKRKRVRANA